MTIALKFSGELLQEAIPFKQNQFLIEIFISDTPISIWNGIGISCILKIFIKNFISKIVLKYLFLYRKI
jgi:hypothetical protein